MQETYFDADFEALSQVIRGEHLALMLYGSQARGVARDDSDVDVLQLVHARPHSYSRGSVNVTAYTDLHLDYLAKRGSLFVRHLRDEGVILDDPDGRLQRILDLYREPTSYRPLQLELRIILEAIRRPDARQYQSQLDQLTKFVVRSALYVHTAASGEPIFDLDQAASKSGLPELASSLRSLSINDLGQLIAAGEHLLTAEPPADMPSTFHGIAIWAIGKYDLAASQLEQIIAGSSRIDYSLLTLPPS